MALTRKFASNRSKQVRRNANGSKQGCGDDTHMLVGSTGSGGAEYLYRSLVQFALNWSSVRRIVKIELAVKTETSSTHYTVGSKPRSRIQRLTAAFSDGVNHENVWTSGDYQWPASTGAVEFDSPINPATGQAQDEAWVFADVTALMKPVVPKSVLMPDGTAGGGGVWHGLLLRTPGDEKSNTQRMIFYSFDRSGSTNDPYLLLTYDPVNQAPTAPTLTGPATANNTFADLFEGDHHDPDLDPMASREIVVYAAGGTTPVWTLPASLLSAGSDETQTGHFSVPLSLAVGSLKLQTDYEWIARTQDPSGLWGPYSARRALRITSSAPSVVATNVTSVAALANNILFGGVYSDPENNPLVLFQLQMQASSAHTDAAFADPNTYVWDTGVTAATAGEIAAKKVARPYAGQALGIGTYTYRIRVQDSSGIWSTWSYDDWTLTNPYDPDPGNITLTTQIARNAPVRIALYKMGALRAPGALIGHIDDPMDLGASAFLNGGGEIYFTLPALHPYCPEIEPHSTHYAVEQYYGDRYRVLFAGIITDFDAVADEMVAYGTDYLGLLQTAVDERYDPNKPDVAADGNGGGGSRYPDQTLDYIIKDQLRYHKALPNSPVGFITVGPITALAERATIYSTYTEALPFISGLIDSHKQGTGRESRFYARPTNPAFTAWEWALVDNWGRDRPNIRLEYGGLLNDFRVVALGDFGTRVLGVGQKRAEVKVYRAVGTGGLDEAQWGRRAKTRFYADIIDQNDLQRRVNEDANQLAKVGKRMALAIRADMLSPFDGWDLGDSIVVDIIRGVVDTSRYGSLGLWTIYGIEWRYHPDGHTDLTLTILPKKSTTPPNPDLIPSMNPGVPNAWQTGYGVPTVYGVAPSATPPPPTLLSATLSSPADTWRYRTGFTAPAAGQMKVNPGNTQLLISKLSDAGWDRAPELLELVIGSLIRVRATGGFDRIGEITNAADLGSYHALTYTPLLAVGALPSNNSPVLVNAKAIGTFSFYPPTTDTVIAKHYEDLNTGCVYELDEGTGVYTEVYCPETGGGTAPPTPDTTPPATPTLSSLTSAVVVDSDGESLVELRATVVHPADLDLFATYVAITSENDGNPDPSLAVPIWTNAAVISIGKETTVGVLKGAAGNTRYWARAFARDISGNTSAYTSVISHTSVKDNVAPGIPAGVQAVPGFKAIGLTWSPSTSPDLMFNEVRYAPDNGAGAPDTTASTWQTPALRVRTNTVVITNLPVPTTPIPYWAQVRAVDFSGNVVTSDVDSTAVDYLANPEAGWCVAVSATPTLIGAADVAFNSVITNILKTNEIDAATILAGTLKVDAGGNGADGIEVWNGPVRVGLWDETGLYIGTNAAGLPADLSASDYTRMYDGGVTVYLHGVPQTAITPSGINATAINFGTLPGGMNLVKNSSFELAAFSTSVPTSKDWTVAADWTGTEQTQVNRTNGAGAVSVTATTY